MMKHKHTEDYCRDAHQVEIEAADTELMALLLELEVMINEERVKYQSEKLILECIRTIKSLERRYSKEASLRSEIEDELSELISDINRDIRKGDSGSGKKHSSRDGSSGESNEEIIEENDDEIKKKNRSSTKNQN